ncbi:MAG: aconitase X catalytic domain-containing protein [Oscillospiraceae bacterium]|nr:aconitase X catalytic domain-containing protein [Oscillospiraceae bacterium]
MIRLTQYEQDMLDGKQGKFKQKAMEFIVRYASVIGAEELCEISRATLFVGAQHYLYCYSDGTDYQKIFSEFYLCSDEPLELGKISDSCEAQTCEGACDLFGFEKTHVTRAQFEKNALFLEETLKMGISIVDSCSPYYLGWIPLMGESFVSTESSNVLMSNSVFGARGNSDGVEAAVCAAITGRTPKWGLHIKENRSATCLMHVDFAVESLLEWDVLGFTLGRLLPKGEKPVLSGPLRRPDIHKLRQLFSSLAVTGAAEICHIAGLTPEAQTLDMALGNKPPKYEIVVSRDEYEKSYAMLCDEGEGPVDLVSIGCPHLSLGEIKHIAEYIAGKKINNSTELQIWAGYPTKKMATVNGFTKTIEESGAYLLTGSCPVLMQKESHKHVKAMVMNGAKQAWSIRHQTRVPVYFGDFFQCIDAAVSGRWTPPPRDT